MGRPRKNRVGEYAAALTEELTRILGSELSHVLETREKAQTEEVAHLERELRALRREVEELRKFVKGRRKKVGHWVPGGPGRPPKDADARIAAFRGREKRNGQ